MMRSEYTTTENNPPNFAPLSFVLSLMAPGAGFAFNGRFLTGAALNLLFAFCIFAYLLSWSIFKFFPLWTTLSALLVAFVFLILCAFGAYARYRAKHHFVAAFLLSVVTFCLPVFFAYTVASSYIFTRTMAVSDAMYPNIIAGDVVIVDRSAFLFRKPRRGDIVLVEDNAVPKRRYFGRIIAVENDVLSGGFPPSVNHKKLRQFSTAFNQILYELPFDSVHDNDVEEPSRWYAVSQSEHFLKSQTLEYTLKKQTYFLLSDNRAGGEATLGSLVDENNIKGRPLFILYNNKTKSFFERSGFKLR